MKVNTHCVKESNFRSFELKSNFKKHSKATQKNKPAFVNSDKLMTLYKDFISLHSFCLHVCTQSHQKRWDMSRFLRLSISARKSNFWICGTEIGFRPTLLCSMTLQGWTKRRKSFQCTTKPSTPDSPDLQHSHFLYECQSGWAGTADCIKVYCTTFFLQLSSALNRKSDLDFKTFVNITRGSKFLNIVMSTVWHQLFRFWQLWESTLFQLSFNAPLTVLWCHVTYVLLFLIFLIIFSGLVTVEKKPHMSALTALSWSTHSSGMASIRVWDCFPAEKWILFPTAVSQREWLASAEHHCTSIRSMCCWTQAKYPQFV